ncbi:MAG: histidine phosphatase family protein [Ottowia sp.]|uniref:histidine phosphatase family protein n=1 Tax=Ottowia sp. TaxID=1898956 RepID=UPI0039E2D0CD
MTLWLVRHAPVLAAPGLCYGASDLSAEPEATRAAAERLAVALPEGLAVHASPLQRCEQLARVLQALRPDLTLKTDARLREMDFGGWEGVPWADIPRADFDAWLAGFADARPAGDGETVRELMARVAAAWDAHRARGEPAVWITHAGVMRAVLLLARGVRLPERATDWPAEPLPFGRALRVQPSRSR